MKELPLSDAILQLLETRLSPLALRPTNSMVNLTTNEGEIERAGIVPYVYHVNASEPYIAYYVMKPRPKHLESRGQPLFQIAKGTRFYKDVQMDGSLRWVDGKDLPYETVRHMPPEPLLRTALREGMEEIALEPLAIEKLYDLGPVSFRSEQTAIGKSMWLFASQLESESHLPQLETHHHTTEAAQWCSLQEFRHIGRPDHLLILTEIDKLLLSHLRQKKT